MTDEQARRVAPVSFLGAAGPGGGLHRRKIERARDTQSTLRRLMGFLQPYRRALGAVAVIATIGTGLALVTPYLIGRAIDQLARHDPEALLVTVLLAGGLRAVSGRPALPGHGDHPGFPEGDAGDALGPLHAPADPFTQVL